jgi:hypothetical protein
MLLASSGWRSQGRPAQASRSRNRDPIDRSAHLTWERGGEVWQRALPGPRRDPGTGSPSFLTLLGRSRSRQRDVVLGIPEMIASSSPARTACLNRNGGFAPRRGTPPVPPAARSSNRQSELRCPLGIPRAPAHPGSIRNLSRGRPTPSATSPLTSARRCEPSRPLASATRALRGDGRRRGRRRVRRPPGRPSADGDAARHRISATAPHSCPPTPPAATDPPGGVGQPRASTARRLCIRSSSSTGAEIGRAVVNFRRPDRLLRRVVTTEEPSVSRARSPTTSR